MLRIISLYYRKKKELLSSSLHSAKPPISPQHLLPQFFTFPMTVGNPSFTSIASILKLQGKGNYEEWRNEVQSFCEINSLWRYMLRQIPMPAALPLLTAGTVQDPVLNEANKAKIMKWLTLTYLLWGVIRLTCNVEPMLHMSGMDLCSNMWTKFEALYWDTGFMERNEIFIRLSTQTASDFSNLRTAWSAIVHVLKKLAQRSYQTGSLPHGYFMTLTLSMIPFVWC